jgi:hypothetical protein
VSRAESKPISLMFKHAFLCRQRFYMQSLTCLKNQLSSSTIRE